MKINYRQPNCAECPALLRAQPFSDDRNYCNGFGGKKKKSMGKKVPTRKIMDWCPKRISPPTCRIFGFVDDNAASMEFEMHHSLMVSKDTHAFPSPFHYKFKQTYPLGLTAKAFCSMLETTPVSTLFPDYKFEFGEVIEINDGFKPYYFYFAGGSKFLTVLLFDTTMTTSGK